MDTERIPGLDLCAAFDVQPREANRWVVRTPLLHQDGDALPVVVERHGDEWQLTDDGMTVSHFFFEDDSFEHTDARTKRVSLLVSAAGGSISDHHRIVLPLDGPPSAYDIGDFLQLVSQVGAIPILLGSERDTRYARAIETQITQRLLTADFEPNWSPPIVAERLLGSYTADMRISSDTGEPIVLFIAGTTDRANVAALSVHHFREAGYDMQPILAYNRDRVSSVSVYRFQDEIQGYNDSLDQDDGAVPAAPGDLDALVSGLRRRGAPIS
jgi:hypothetical protein